MPETINPGDYVLIQREDYMKLHKIKEKSAVQLGPYRVEVDALIGQKFYEHFQMQLKTNKLYTLVKVQDVKDYSTIDIKQSGADNRHIQDDGNSQQLSKEEIEKLRETNANSTDILEHLISNSKTFDKKTEYAQVKYLKKKQKKYYGYITARKPSIRLLMNVFYKQDPAKILGMRIDDLSQILTYANIQAGGNYLLYDSGSNGILPAAIVNLLGDRDGAGSETETGRLVYMHPGNECQKMALQAMQFPEAQSNRCVNVNSYSVLRWFYQKITTKEEYVLPAPKELPELSEKDEINLGKRKLPEDDENDGHKDGDKEVKKPRRPQWHYQNETACELLHAGMDSLIIAAKEHPVSIADELLPFLKPSRNFVAFSTLREPLQDLYFALVNRPDLTNVKLSGNFMRHYQVLPERTHPLVNMNFGGYLLTAIKTKI